MTVDFESDKHDLDEYTSELMETARLLIEHTCQYVTWSDDPEIQTYQFICAKSRCSSCLQIISACSGCDAQQVVNEVFNQFPESYVPWEIFKKDYLPLNKELHAAFEKAQEEGKNV